MDSRSGDERQEGLGIALSVQSQVIAVEGSKSRSEFHSVVWKK